MAVIIYSNKSDQFKAHLDSFAIVSLAVKAVWLPPRDRMKGSCTLVSLLRVVVQDEHGAQMGEPVDFPASILSRASDARFRQLSFIDPYGDTVFNRLQVPGVLEELRLLKSLLPGEENRIEKIEGLALACQGEPHLYLKFIGD